MDPSQNPKFSTPPPSSRCAATAASRCRRRPGHARQHGDEGQCAQGAPPRPRRPGAGRFAGAAADAFTLFELFEAKLEKHGQLTRAAVELAKDWRTERRLGKLEALLAVADKETSLIISGTGDVIEPEDG
jgi:hypothetical protein